MNNLKEYTVNGNCSSCGECCSPSPMPFTKEEELVIKKYIKKHNIESTKIGFINETSIKLECCFRDVENKKCKIYDVRPSICRKFKCDNSLEKINNDKIITHKEAYYNKSVNSKLGIERMTNFELQFYGNPYPLILYLLSNLENHIPDYNKRRKYVLDLLTKNGSKKTKKIMLKLILEEENKK